MITFYRLAAMLASALSLSTAAAAQAPEPETIQVVKAIYGVAGASHPYDFSARLQETCGDRSNACESFCSNALIGRARSDFRLPFAARPICRVIYRCGAGATRAMETQVNETLFLSCRQH